MLQFNPYDEIRRRNEVEPDFNQTVTNPIMQGLQMMIQNRQQNELLDLKRQEAERADQQFKTEYGFDAPVAPRASFDPESGSVTPIQQPRRMLKPFTASAPERFQSQRRILRSPMASQVQSTLGLPEGYTPGTKHYDTYGSMVKNMATKVNNPMSLDELLASKVQSGEMTMEEALGLKRRKDSGVDFNDDPSLAVPGYDSTGEVRVGKSEAERLRKAQAEYQTFTQVLGEYRNLVANEGTTSINPRKRAAMEAYAKRLQLIVKNLAQLGVLSASDIPFIEKQISGPGFWQTESGMLGALDTTKSMADAANTNLMRTAGYQARGFGGSNETAPPPPPKSKTIRQNGFTYTLNEQTGQYE